MKQIFLDQGKIILHDVAIPEIGEKDILVAVHYSFISSGTENATITASGSLLKRFLNDVPKYGKKISDSIKENGLQGTISLIKGKQHQLLELGYSCSGRVIKIGSLVSKIKVGDYVACAGSGVANHAEFVAIPENLAVIVKDELFLKQASLTAIGAIAMQGIRRANLQLGEKVCVIGMGLIGQLALQLAKLAGCSVIGVDILDERLALAEKLGCDKVVNVQSNVLQEIAFFTEHYGVDATIITAAGSGVIIDQAMAITRRKGKVVLVGDVKLDFQREFFYSKEIDFLISCSYGPGRYDNVYEKDGVDYPYSYVRWTENRNMQLFVNLIEDKKINIDPIITEQFALNDAQQAYNSLRKSLGVVIKYNPNQIVSTQVNPVIKSYKYPVGKLRVGVVGAGGFAKIKLLPVLNSINDVDITAVVDSNSANAINVVAQYKGINSSSDYKDILFNDWCDMVVIATPHHLHTEQAISFLRAGKAVFLEKPAAVSEDDLQSLSQVLKDENQKFVVDFNRSFAPFNLAIKAEIQKRTSPLVITYRMNAGYISLEHWVQSRKNGGRIIGEACHIFDLFCFLTGARPISITVGAMHPRTDGLLSTDNVSVHINFNDGSICSLLYTAIGSNYLSKERMEIFYDGKSIVMDDYKELTGFGCSLNQKSSSQDKGHKKLLEKFVESALGLGDIVIPFERILLVSKISLIVDKLALQGGGFAFIDKE